jgi:hypothetical protein
MHTSVLKLNYALAAAVPDSDRFCCCVQRRPFSAIDCQEWNGGCQHLCVASSDGVNPDHCECQSGYEVRSTTKCRGEFTKSIRIHQ